MDWRQGWRLGILVVAVAVGLASNELAAQNGGPAGYRLRDSGQRLGSETDLGTDVVAGDVDSDGDIDVVTVGSQTPTRVWLNDGDGRFTASRQILGTNAVAVAWDPGIVGRAPRIVLAHDDTVGSLRVWHGPSRENFALDGNLARGGDLPSALAIGDLGGELEPDIVLTRYFNPTELWTTPWYVTVGDAPLTIPGHSALKVALGDLDRDGAVDVFLAGEDLSAWMNPGRAPGEPTGVLGPFTPAGPAFGPGLTLGVALADLDGDGDLDAVTAGSDPHPDRVWINQGGTQGGAAAQFTDSGQRLGPGTGQSRDVALADMDGDGDVDAVVARPRGNLVYWNDGAGRFTAESLKFGDGPAEALALGDFNRDGRPDVFVVHFGAPAEVWLSELPRRSIAVPEYWVEAWAGTGESGSGGDGGPALAAYFHEPTDLAVDGDGTVYVLEGGGRRVRRIAVDGTVSTRVQSTGGASAGDGGPLSQAEFGQIGSVAADARGNVYLAETANRRIRRIATDGTVSTVAGTGLSGYRGDGGPAVGADLSVPSVVRLDAAGNLYVLDRGDRVIRRVDTNGIITTVAGNRLAGLSGDGGPAVAASIDSPDNLMAGPDGSLFLVYRLDGRIRQVSPSGIISTVAGTLSFWGESNPVGNGGAATVSQLNSPSSLTLDRHHHLVIGESAQIRQVDSDGLLAVIAGGRTGGAGDGGPALSAGISDTVRAMVGMPDGALVFTDGHRLRRLTLTGNAVPVAPRLASTPPAGHEFDFGRLEQGSAPSWQTYRIELKNSGSADLMVNSVELSGNTRAFRNPAVVGDFNTPLTLPYRLRPATSRLRVILECVADTAQITTNEAVLRITTDDPVTPVVEFVLRAATIQATPQEEPYVVTSEEALLYLLIKRWFGTDGGDPEATPRSRHDVSTESQEFLLQLDPDRSHSLTTEVPDHLGGGSVTIDRFQGEVLLRTRPDPNDAGFLELTVVSGQFQASSFLLPIGIASGPTTLTFGDPALSSGRLNRSTGEYSAKASATIVNPLFPKGLPVSGSYWGTYDAQSGRATLRSFSVDRVPLNGGLEVIRDGDGAVVTWTSASSLESAPSVLGPWQRHTNAVSPHRIDLRDDGPRFYRLSGGASRPQGGGIHR